MDSDLTTSLDYGKRHEALKAARLSHFEVVDSKKLIKKNFLLQLCSRYGCVLDDFEPLPY